MPIILFFLLCTSVVSFLFISINRSDAGSTGETSFSIELARAQHRNKKKSKEGTNIIQLVTMFLMYSQNASSACPLPLSVCLSAPLTFCFQDMMSEKDAAVDEYKRREQASFLRFFLCSFFFIPKRNLSWFWSFLSEAAGIFICSFMLKKNKKKRQFIQFNLKLSLLFLLC